MSGVPMGLTVLDEMCLANERLASGFADHSMPSPISSHKKREPEGSLFRN